MTDELELLERLREENTRLRNLCLELEPVQDERDQLLADHGEIGQAIGCNHIADGLARCVRDIVDERDALAKFKAWVHTYLDNKGIPTHFPDGPHSKEGCRIGDWMDAVFADLTAARALVGRLAGLVIRYWEWQRGCQELLPSDLARDTDAALAEARAAKLLTDAKG